MSVFATSRVAKTALEVCLEAGTLRAVTLPPYLKVQDDVIYVSLKVQPRASRNEIGEAIGNELKVKVTAPPVDSAANQAVIELLADILDCPRGAVQIVRGATARHKTVAIRGVPTAKVIEML